MTWSKEELKIYYDFHMGAAKQKREASMYKIKGQLHREDIQELASLMEDNGEQACPAEVELAPDGTIRIKCDIPGYYDPIKEEE